MTVLRPAIHILICQCIITLRERKTAVESVVKKLSFGQVQVMVPYSNFFIIKNTVKKDNTAFIQII